MLWRSGAMLVKAMENLPALAVSDVLSYFSWPSGLASRLNGGAALAGAGAVDTAEVDLVGGAGRTFGLEGAGLEAGSEDVAVLDVAGLTDCLAGVGVVALGTGADVVTVLDAVGVLATLAGVDVEGLVLLDDSPQPASAIRPTASVSVVSLDIERGVALSGCSHDRLIYSPWYWASPTLDAGDAQCFPSGFWTLAAPAHTGPGRGPSDRVRP
jgi:hypothetical protein